MSASDVPVPAGVAPPLASASTQSAVSPPPAYRLFDTTSVGIAAFLGAPIAGTALMAVNYRRLGKNSAALIAIASGVAATAAAILIGTRVPATYSTVPAIALFVGTYNAAKSLQGKIVSDHVARGGRLSSRWIAGGLGVAVMMISLALIFGTIFMAPPVSKIVVGTLDSVEYSGKATSAEATALGQSLKTVGYFTDRGASVLLSRNSTGAVISFVVRQDAASQPAMAYAFESIGYEVSPTVGGPPVTLQFVNSQRAVLKKFSVGRATIGAKDQIYYSGKITAAEANALGQSLRSLLYFQDLGANVFLTKDDAGTAIGYMLPDGNWNQPDQVTAFEDLTRRISSTVGGLPITMRLLSLQLELEKEEVVK